MISAIRKKSTAEESAKGIFQTSNLIVSHFKREKDLNEIIKLTGETNTLSKLLIASSVVHAYHYLGVKTINSLDIEVSVEESEKIELMEKKELYKEIEELVSDSIEYELKLLLKSLEYEEQIVSIMKDRNEHDEKFQEKLKTDFEEELTEIINKYPIVCVYDYIGSLVGFRDTIKSQLIEEASAVKPTSIEIEKRLTLEANIDRYIELSTLQRLYEQMQKRFEFRTVKDLRNELYPIKKITGTALDYNLNKYPISIQGLETILDSIRFKKQLYSEFISANAEKINYEKFESSMFEKIEKSLLEQMNEGSSRFIYYIQNLLETNGQGIFDLLNRFGISDLDALVSLSKLDRISLMNTFKALNIIKTDLLTLNKKPNIFDKLEEALNELKRKNMSVSKKSILEIIISHKTSEIEYVKDACKLDGETYEGIISLYNKLQVVNQISKNILPIGGINWLILLFDFNSIMQNLSRIIYYSIFSSVCKQMSRILEVYIKINEDKSILLLGIKKVLEGKDESDWVRIKIEELLIQRIMKRQKELAAVFNAENNPFYVNGYILARLIDSNLKLVMDDLKDKPSICYEGISELALPRNIISPVSYPLAYEVFRKFILNHELDKIKVEELVEQNKEAEEEKKKVIKSKQEEKTLDWIEKRIVQSMMIITREGINPTNLYWDDEKDLKVCMNAIKSHAELKGKKICPQCGTEFDKECCPNHSDNIGLKDSFIDLVSQFYFFSLQKIYELSQSKKKVEYAELRNDVKALSSEILKQRIKREPNDEDFNKTIEGERLQIAKGVAENIGIALNKALNKKFKESLANKKSTITR